MMFPPTLLLDIGNRPVAMNSFSGDLGQDFEEVRQHRTAKEPRPKAYKKETSIVHAGQHLK